MPTVAQACMIVPSVESRLILPAVFLAVASTLLYFSFRVCFRHSGIWWKIPIPFGFALIASWLYRLYLEFNFSGAVDCGLPFNWVVDEVLVISVVIWTVVILVHFISIRMARKK